MRLLEALQAAHVKARFYRASSSVLSAPPPPPNEDTPFHPRSPYSVSKLYGY